VKAANAFRSNALCEIPQATRGYDCSNPGFLVVAVSNATGGLMGKYTGRRVVKRDFNMAITRKFVIINEIPPNINRDYATTKDGNIL
jgi:hypothetical protein